VVARGWSRFRSSRHLAPAFNATANEDITLPALWVTVDGVSPARCSSRVSVTPSLSAVSASRSVPAFEHSVLSVDMSMRVLAVFTVRVILFLL
jgi:hypothetical protein